MRLSSPKDGLVLTRLDIMPGRANFPLRPSARSHGQTELRGASAAKKGVAF
jgi:hypothetical protein